MLWLTLNWPVKDPFPESALRVPDPNTFGGPVKFLPANEKVWREMPMSHGYVSDSRGLGVAEMARSIRLGRPARANGEMALHIIEIAQGIHDASRENRHVRIDSRFPMPAPLPAGLAAGEVD